MQVQSGKMFIGGLALATAVAAVAIVSTQPVGAQAKQPRALQCVRPVQAGYEIEIPAGIQNGLAEYSVPRGYTLRIDRLSGIYIAPDEQARGGFGIGTDTGDGMVWYELPTHPGFPVNSHALSEHVLLHAAGGRRVAFSVDRTPTNAAAAGYFSFSGCLMKPV